MAWISVVPLIVVLILLFRQRNMVVAAAAGGLLAIVIAYLFREHLPLVQESVNGETRVVILDLKRAFYRFSSTIPSMLSFTSPIVNASAAAMVAAFGGFAALLEIARRRLNGRMELLAAFVVMLQAFATYTAGLGAGNTVITAPLIAAAVGATPGVIMGMAIATAGAFTTSPSSAESALTSRIAGLSDVGPYVADMRPFFLMAVAIGMAIAWWDVRRRKGAFVPGDDIKATEGTPTPIDTFGVTPETPARQLWARATPALWLLGAVVLGRPLNDLFVAWGLPQFFSPMVYISITVVLVFLMRLGTIDSAAQKLIEGGSFILVRLFAVGLFLAFVNMISDIGAFQLIAKAALQVPKEFVVSVAALVGFLIAIPAGAYAVAVMGLIGPALGAAGFTPLQLGFVMMVIGMGTQMSWSQLNVASLSYGFKVSISRIVRINAPGVIAMALLLAGLAYIFG